MHVYIYKYVKAKEAVNSRHQLKIDFKLLTFTTTLIPVVLCATLTNPVNCIGK